MVDISQCKPPKTFQTKLFINNEFVTAMKGGKISVINPSNEQEICKVEEASELDIEYAIDCAKKAFKVWKNTHQKERARCIRNLADKIQENIIEIISLESLDNGKPLEQSRDDIQEVVDNLRYMAGFADKLTGKTFNTGDQSMSYYTNREPFGVVGCISPWNFPLLMAEWKFGAALAAGNCVVHKCSEVTPLTMLYIAKFIPDCGFPPGVFNIVTGYGNIAGEALCMSPYVSKISFTGSTLVGRKILDYSQKSNLKKVHLELGGKSPVIICPDADLDAAAELAFFAIMYNMGQCCDCGSRLYIHEKVYDQVLQRLKKHCESVKIGDAFEGASHGPQVNQVQFSKIMGYIEECKIAGFKLLTGGERFGNKGYFIKPTVFVDVPEQARCVKEEVFGPFLTILKPWKNIDEVIQRANDTEYGLAAFVCTNNASWQRIFETELDVGTVYGNLFIFLVNIYSIAHFVPFGGYKQSGFGKDGGEEGILEFTHTKAVYKSFKQIENRDV